MTDVWHARVVAGAARTAQTLSSTGAQVARKVSVETTQRVLVLLLALWIALSVVRAIWSFFPEPPATAPAAVLNPPTAGDATVDSLTGIDIDALVATHLFGEPGAEPPPAASEPEVVSGRPPTMSEDEAAQALAGIEDGAPETRLPLVLRGVVAASEAGLGQAVIEHRNAQDLYQVGDELPVNPEVVLAKVLPELVVLDNAGRYELLRLFEGSDLSAQVDRSRVAGSDAARAAEPRAAQGAAAMAGGDADVSRIAAAYRERLYSDPQSLADVIRVAAVREGDELVGYRVSPGSAPQEFSALGFETGDIVTAVNGLPLNNPLNFRRLMEDMRSAQDANFDLIRQGEVLNLNVSIAQLAVNN